MTSLIKGFVDSTIAFATGSYPDTSMSEQSKRSNKRFQVEKLPYHLGRSIMVFSDPQSTARCASVCKAWNRFANDPVIWNRYFDQLENSIKNAGFVVDIHLPDKAKRILVVDHLKNRLARIREAEEFFQKNPDFPGLPTWRYCDTLNDEFTWHVVRNYAGKYNRMSNDDQMQSAKLERMRGVRLTGGPILSNASRAAISLSYVGMSSLEHAEAYDRRANYDCLTGAGEQIIKEHIKNKQFERALNLTDSLNCHLLVDDSKRRAFSIIIKGLCKDNQNEKAQRIFDENRQLFDQKRQSEIQELISGQKAGAQADLEALPV